MLQKAPIQSNQTKVTRGTRKSRQNDSNGQQSLQKRTEQFLWSVGTRRNFKMAFYSTYPSILSDILQLSEKAKCMEKNPDIMKPRCNEHDCQSRGVSHEMSSHSISLVHFVLWPLFVERLRDRGKAPIQSNYTKATQGTCRNRQNDSNGQWSLQKKSEQQFLWSVGIQRNFEMALYFHFIYWLVLFTLFTPKNKNSTEIVK